MKSANSAAKTGNNIGQGLGLVKTPSIENVCHLRSVVKPKNMLCYNSAMYNYEKSLAFYLNKPF
jgi:hypothetical protein